MFTLSTILHSWVVQLLKAPLQLQIGICGLTIAPLVTTVVPVFCLHLADYSFVEAPLSSTTQEKVVVHSPSVQILPSSSIQTLTSTFCQTMQPMLEGESTFSRIVVQLK